MTGSSLMLVSTGCPGLDVMLNGGLIPSRPYIVCGPPGSGKTTLAIQFLLEGLKNNERVLYVTLDEPPNELRDNLQSFGWKLDDIYIFDAIPDIMIYEKTPIKDISSVRDIVQLKYLPESIRKTDEFKPVNVTFNAIQQTLKQEMLYRRYDRIVIDSVTGLRYFTMRSFDINLGIQSFFRFLSELKVTSLLIVETPEKINELEPEIFLARGVIQLHRFRTNNGTTYAIAIEKYRGADHDIKTRPFRFTRKGIEVYPDQEIIKEEIKEIKKVLEIEKIPEVEEVPEISREPAIQKEASEPVQTLQSNSTRTQEENAAFGNIVVQMMEDIRDCTAIGIEVEDVHTMVAKSITIMNSGNLKDAMSQLMEARRELDHRIFVYQTKKELEEQAKADVEVIKKTLIKEEMKRYLTAQASGVDLKELEVDAQKISLPEELTEKFTHLKIEEQPQERKITIEELEKVPLTNDELKKIKEESTAIAHIDHGVPEDVSKQVWDSVLTTETKKRKTRAKTEKKEEKKEILPRKRKSVRKSKVSKEPSESKVES